MKGFHFIEKCRNWIFLLPVILLTGCIEIVEDITIHPDRSGTVSYSIEVTKAGALLSGLASLVDASWEGQIRMEADNFIRRLQAQPGISNIHYDLPGRNGTYSLTFDFEKESDFNEAIYEVSGNKKTIFSPGYLKIGNSRIKKFNFSPWLRRYIENQDLEMPSPLITDNIYFRSVIHTPEDIKRVNSETQGAFKSSRETVQKFLMTDILNGEVNTGIRIRY